MHLYKNVIIIKLLTLKHKQNPYINLSMSAKMLFVALVLGISGAFLSKIFLSDFSEEKTWWYFLCSGVILNIALLLTRETRTKHERRQKLFSFLFILSNTVRSIFPRIDVESISVILKGIIRYHRHGYRELKIWKNIYLIISNYCVINFKNMIHHAIS